MLTSCPGPDRRSGCLLPDSRFSFLGDAQGSKISAPTTYKNISIACVTVVTWNKPLYNPSPDPIACTYNLLNEMAALKSKIIEVIRVNSVGVIVDE